jgi:hypothetical protein
MHDLADPIDAALSILGALPYQMRQRRRSTCTIITAFAFIRSGPSVDSPLAAPVACCIRMAM